MRPTGGRYFAKAPTHESAPAPLPRGGKGAAHLIAMGTQAGARHGGRLASKYAIPIRKRGGIFNGI
jgi:hypothetical protein